MVRSTVSEEMLEMNTTESETGRITPTKKNTAGSIIKKTWPVFSNHLPGTLTWNAAWLSLNIIIVSELFWPGEPFHAQELSILVGSSGIIGAFTGIIFGMLADRFTRTKLMAIQTVMDGTAFFLFGITPTGLGLVSFGIFLGINLFKNGTGGGGEIIANSYLNDVIEEGERSQFYGLLSIMQQVIYILIMMLTATIFKEFWRWYFWTVGVIIIVSGIAIGLKAREPKRGAVKDELRSILKLDSVVYKYQLTKDTVKSTLFSKSNVLIIIEGLFTQVILSIPAFVLIAFLQTPPHNFSPLAMGFITVVFGIPGSIIGNLVLAKYSDRKAEKDIRNRVYIIFGSILSTYMLWVLVMYLPFPNLTPIEGGNLAILFSYPVMWIGGAIMVVNNIIWGAFALNQRPLIQRLNLPEAQGMARSVNSFFEAISYGTGTIISGSLLVLLGLNYQLTVVFLMLIGMVGACIWLGVAKFIPNDLERISKLLKARSKELESGVHSQ